MKETATLFNRQQAHAVFTALWERVKAELQGGKRLQVSVKPERRSLDQNAKFHALCEDAARAGLVWAGKPRSAAEWKVLLVSGHAAATNLGAEIVAGLEGEFVNIRESTAAMDKARGSSLIEYTLAFLAQQGVAVHQERTTP
jgi:hypothetical protein